MAPLVVRGRVRVPGDKSISHRALILAAMADGTSRITGILESADIHATASALRAMGVEIPALGPDLVVRGRGVAALHTPEAPLDCANSGTTTRLLAGVVAALVGRSARFEGDASLSRRPMRRVAAPLEAMGATIRFEGAPGHDGLPMRVEGAPLRALQYVNDTASAQVKSALLLAGVASGVAVTIEEPRPSRDHTERMLAARGVQIRTSEGSVHLEAAQTVAPSDTAIPADPSSAVFLAALAALAQQGTLRLEGVCLNPSRTGAFDVLRRMGVSLTVEDLQQVGGEPVGTVVVTAGSPLRATTIEGSEVPRAIDELPMLACLASRADGETIIRDAQELRVKESDRIRGVVSNLQRLGVDAEETPDGLRVRGSARSLAGTVITHGDHRVAMAFGVLAAVPGHHITIDDPACVAVSYPGFWRDLALVTGTAAPEVIPARGVVAPLVIAIDGPAASGKSSTAQWVAQLLDVRHVDSGAFYRAITYLAVASGTPPEAWTAEFVLAQAPRIAWRLTERSVLPLVDGLVQDDALRDKPVTQQVSRVAKMAPVRDWVNAQVRAAGAAVDVVVDGRDIGTAVFPDAALKVFLVADTSERARRRLIQRLGRRPTEAEIAEEADALVMRDAQDATQSAPAPDAVTIDTTALTQEDQVEQIVELARAARAARARLEGAGSA